MVFENPWDYTFPGLKSQGFDPTNIRGRIDVALQRRADGLFALPTEWVGEYRLKLRFEEFRKPHDPSGVIFCSHIGQPLRPIQGYRSPAQHAAFLYPSLVRVQGFMPSELVVIDTHQVSLETPGYARVVETVLWRGDYQDLLDSPFGYRFERAAQASLEKAACIGCSSAHFAKLFIKPQSRCPHRRHLEILEAGQDQAKAG